MRSGSDGLVCSCADDGRLRFFGASDVQLPPLETGSKPRTIEFGVPNFETLTGTKIILIWADVKIRVAMK